MSDKRVVLSTVEELTRTVVTPIDVPDFPNEGETSVVYAAHLSAATRFIIHTKYITVVGWGFLVTKVASWAVRLHPDRRLPTCAMHFPVTIFPRFSVP